LYIGITEDIEQRIRDHNSGRGSFTTKKKKPVKLIYYEIYDSKEIAALRERQIKGWTKIKKENLVKYGHPKPG